MPETRLWGILWRSENRLNGVTRQLLFRNGRPLVFQTRSAARAYVKAQYGYIGKRPDLRAEPHGWRLPLPVKMKLIWEPEAAHA